MFSDNQKNEIPSAMSRRTFFTVLGAAAAALAWSYFQRREPVHAATASAGSPKPVKVVQFTDAGQRQDSVTVPKIIKTDDE